MVRWDYELRTEDGPTQLVDDASAAEQAGFDFVAASDHFSPWIVEQGHSPFVWSVLGAIAARTDRIGLMTAVTCPLVRYHPAVIAQAAATMSLLSAGRFTLGLGTGERLNEHVVGGGWPGVGTRHRMMEEALEILSQLLSGDGEEHTFRGSYFELENAKLFDPAPRPLPLVIAAGGPQAARLAAERGDGLITTAPEREVVDAYREAGGKGPLYAEVALSYGSDEQEAREIAHRLFRWSTLGWKAQTELPDVEAFAQASENARPEDLAEKIPCGPDRERHVEACRPFLELGFDHLILVQIGPEQRRFLDFFDDGFRTALEECAREVTPEPVAVR